MLQNIDSEIRDGYVGLLKRELYKKYPGKKQSEIATIIGFGVTTYHNVFKNKSGTNATIEEIAKAVSFVSLERYAHRKPLLDKILERILTDGGKWISYCFNNRRRLYESTWVFTEKRKYDSVEGDSEYYIEVIRDTVDHRYVGELILGSDMTMSISTKSSPGFEIDYFSKFSEDIEESFYENMEYLLFEATAMRRKEFFTSLEILAKVKDEDIIVPKTIEYQNVLPDFDNNFVPKNLAYLSFNYLTRCVSKSRRVIDNYRINHCAETSGPLLYNHDVFIACPLTYIQAPEEFDKLKDSVNGLIQVLENELGFSRNNIHCGILEHDSIKDIRRDERYQFFESRKFVGSTHFIALVPEELKNNNSGIYMEMYFRILKKLPALIFIENKQMMPSLLRGLMDSPDRPLNFTFKDNIKVTAVADYVKTAKKYIFQYSL